MMAGSRPPQKRQRAPTLSIHDDPEEDRHDGRYAIRSGFRYQTRQRLL
jgi:hypothetical protein